MNIILYLYEAALLGYTAWRTYDFFTYNLPTNIGSEIAILGLFAMDLGLILWHTNYRKFAKSEIQEKTALSFAIMDFLGSLGVGTADMILRQNLIEYAIPELLAKLLLYGVPVIVAGNIFAVMFYQLNDPDEMENRAKRRITAKVMSIAIKNAEQSAEAIATELRDDIAGEIKRQARAEIHGRYKAAKLEKESGKSGVASGKSEEILPEIVANLSGNGGGKSQDIGERVANFLHPRRK